VRQGTRGTSINNRFVHGSDVDVNSVSDHVSHHT
jgi:hypothetical protein